MAETNHTKDRDEDIIPVVRKLIKALGDMPDLMMGSRETISADQAALYYQKVYQETVVPMLMEANIKLDAIQYLFSMAMQPFQLLNDITTSSFEMNKDLADTMKWGKDIHEIRVMDLDGVLKEGALAIQKTNAEKAVDNK